MRGGGAAAAAVVRTRGVWCSAGGARKGLLLLAVFFHVQECLCLRLVLLHAGEFSIEARSAGEELLLVYVVAGRF